MFKDTVQIGNHYFDTLIALTEYEQARGLMEKSWPPPVMCFPYKKSSIHKFWMKNTPSPLDIIFVKNNKVLDIFKGEPYSLVAVGPEEPSDLVVELPFGTAKKLGIKKGDPVKIFYGIDTMCRRRKLGI